MTPKRVVVIAGPNGAGKTTFAREFLPNEANCPIFINAGLIAAGLSPFAPELAAFRAGRLMLEAMEEHAVRGSSFAFETNARMIPLWRQAAYVVKLIFLSLPDADMAIARVTATVAQGGHDVPEAVVRRRPVHHLAPQEPSRAKLSRMMPVNRWRITS